LRDLNSRDLRRREIEKPPSPPLARQARGSRAKVLRDRGQDPERLAQHLIRTFGSGAAGKAIEMVRMETNAGNREAAVRWHQIMSLIEESGRKSR
jgi:hypothetical protein